MKTVKELREELAKFPDDAQCFAYEGEVNGIVIDRSGFIPCSEQDDSDQKTVLLKARKTMNRGVK